MTHPLEAADELSRTITHLNFVGALINNHTAGALYSDDKKF